MRGFGPSLITLPGVLVCALLLVLIICLQTAPNKSSLFRNAAVLGVLALLIVMIALFVANLNPPAVMTIGFLSLYLAGVLVGRRRARS